MADIPTDAPVVMQSTVKTMLAQGVDTGDIATDDIVVGDIISGASMSLMIMMMVSLVMLYGSHTGMLH